MTCLMVYLNVDKSKASVLMSKMGAYNMTWSIATGKGIVSENFSIPSSCLVIQMDCFILYHLVSAKQCKQFCQTMQICKMRLCSAPSDYSSYHCHQTSITAILFDKDMLNLTYYI